MGRKRKFKRLIKLAKAVRCTTKIRASGPKSHACAISSAAAFVCIDSFLCGRLSDAMLSRFRHSRANFWVVALYALAVATLGLAHKPVGFSKQAHAVDIAAYAAPDGTLPVICLTDTGQQSPQAAGAGHCDACALSSAPGLAAPAQLGLPTQIFTRFVHVIDPAGQFSPAAQRAPTSRGPPLA